MNSREKAIVAVTVILLIYLVYELASGNLIKEYQNAGVSRAEVATITTKSNATEERMALVKKLYSKHKDKLRLIDKDEIKIKKHVFVDANSLTSQKEATNKKVKKAVPEFIYSSYLKANSRKVAIINNFEYLEGEKIFNHPFTIKKITPSHVIIKSVENQKEFKINYINRSAKTGNN